MADIDENKRFLFTWKIENVSFLHQDTGKDIKSPRFVVDGFGDSEWMLSLFPRGDTEDVAGFLTCYLCRHNKNVNAKDIILSYKIEIIGPSGKVLDTFEKESVSFSPIDRHGKDTFIKLDEVRVEAENVSDDILILRCRICYETSFKTLSTECNSSSKVKVHRQIFKWKYPTAYRHLKTVEQEYISFPDNFEFRISAAKVHNDLSVLIARMNKMYLSRFLHFKLEIVSNKIVINKSCHLTNENKEFLYFPAVFFKDLSKEIYSGETNFDVSFEFSCSGNVHSEKASYGSKSNAVSNAIPNLNDHLYNLFLSKKLCDVKLRVENEIILAHKIILSARSPVFSAMFAKNMSEAQIEIVLIPDMDSTTLTAFLTFLYTETTGEIDFQLAKSLMIVADKYQVHSLKEICSDFLKTNITVENACNVASIANMANDAQLKSHALKFIVDYSHVVLRTPEWLLWTKSHFELTTEIFAKLTENYI